MPTYIATGVVRETGATLTQRITCRGPKLALVIAKEWAHENALKLWQIERLDLVWTHRQNP